jgi:hypothetical protein
MTTEGLSQHYLLSIEVCRNINLEFVNDKSLYSAHHLIYRQTKI